ncbi:hypothetical protein Q3G72_000584 [Acer saccharum]|nr:hypothetical protein Q3G72_000584 [Acer saccharum]
MIITCLAAFVFGDVFKPRPNMLAKGWFLQACQRNGRDELRYVIKGGEVSDIAVIFSGTSAKCGDVYGHIINRMVTYLVKSSERGDIPSHVSQVW